MNKLMDNYGDIISIEAELSGYRCGCLKVTIDLEKKIVIWRDSQQWNNNFLRSISHAQIKQFQHALPTTHILQWQAEYADLAPQEDSVACHDANWILLVFFRKSAPNEPLRMAGQKQFPKEWNLFRDLIESITKVPFRLR